MLIKHVKIGLKYDFLNFSVFGGTYLCVESDNLETSMIASNSFLGN